MNFEEKINMSLNKAKSTPSEKVFLDKLALVNKALDEVRDRK